MLTSNFGSRKGLTLARGRVVRAIARENPPGGLTCRSVNKKIIYTRKFFVIFHPFAEKPPMDGFARNFARGVVWPT